MNTGQNVLLWRIKGSAVRRVASSTFTSTLNLFRAIQMVLIVRGLGRATPRICCCNVQVPLRASELPKSPMSSFVEMHVRRLVNDEEPEVSGTITVRQLARVEVSRCVCLIRMDEVTPPFKPLRTSPQTGDRRGARVVRVAA